MYKTCEAITDIPADCIIFKHSSTCGISARAKLAMDAFVKQHPEIQVILLTIQEQPEFKIAVAETYQVRHESPQVLIIKSGNVTKVLNHDYITVFSVKTAAKEAWK